MGIKNPVRQHYRLLVVGVLLILIAAIFFSLRYGKGGDRQQDGSSAIDGRNLTYFDFDKNNRKTLAIQCQESRRLSNERLFMKIVTATFFKSARLEKDIQMSGDSGTASRGFYDFDIRGRVRIFSSEFSLDGPRFFLENREKLTSRDAVAFKLKNVSGQAAAGMDFFINQNILTLFQCQGTLLRDGQPYEFKTKVFWVMKKNNLLILEKSAELVGAGATARGDWMSLQFDTGFAHLQSATIAGNCFFSTQGGGENGRAPEKEISANFIYIGYDAGGRLRLIAVHNNGRISLRDRKNEGRIASDSTEIYMRPETQVLEKVKVLTRGTLTSRGQDNVTVSGDSMTAFYSADGALSEIKAENNCSFRTAEFQGTAAALNYDAGNFLIDVVGNEAAITSQKNTFNSRRFQIHTRLRKLVSGQMVKATISPGDPSVLLANKPLFITAVALEMTDGGNIIRFRDKVQLFQDDVEIHAGEMLFENASKRMTCHGDAELKFVSENEPVKLRGQTIVFNHSERKAVISDNASLNQAGNTLGGRQIELDFDRGNRLENILARDNVVFSRENLSGRSGLLHWQYRQKIIWFRNSAQITRKDAGTTKGRELILNLNSNEITVSSQEDRAETIIH
ncbi:MAG: hypothetical protein NTW95_12310 [Candidatus Aminicenantes bacterium]|nr:hypothetical protein [Candidatus Aminicenantes bacterium]